MGSDRKKSPPGGKPPGGGSEAPDFIKQEEKPPVQWKVEKGVLRNGYNISWKFASAFIHDYENFENRVSIRCLENQHPHGFKT